MQIGEGELRGPIDGGEEVEPALRGAYVGNVDVEVADRVSLELALYAMPLQAAGQGRAPKVRERRAPGEAIRSPLSP